MHTPTHTQLHRTKPQTAQHRTRSDGQRDCVGGGSLRRRITSKADHFRSRQPPHAQNYAQVKSTVRCTTKPWRLVAADVCLSHTVAAGSVCCVRARQRTNTHNTCERRCNSPPQDETDPAGSRPSAGADGWRLWRHHEVLLGRLRLGRVGAERQRRVRVVLARPCGELAGAGQPPQARAHWPASYATIAADGPGRGDCRARCSCASQLGGPELEAGARHTTDLQLRVRHLRQQRFKRRHSC